MKKLLNLLLTLAIVSSVMAGTVNRQQARETAAKFMQQKGIRLDEASQQGKKTPAAEQPVYVFNAVEGQGFVVVSGDDRTDAILGYTTQGSYDEDNLPPALKEWLSQMTIEIETLQQLPETEAQPSAGARLASAPKAEPQQVTIHQAIPPLIKTEWNQGNTYQRQNYNTDGIYNFRLPKDGSYFPCTGCVATAGAQIMYYFKCPQGPTTDVPGYKNDNPNVNTTNGLPATTFLWDKMKTKYTDADAYSESAEAVAELMLYAGYAAKMRYGVDGSSANQMQLARGMAEYYGYDPYTLSYIKRADYSVAEWDSLMYKEIAEGRPIIYDGAQAADGSNGHAFLCDGYDGAGLYHFNWGWGGSSNGYFKLQATNPDGPNGYPGYIFNNSAVIGIQPFSGVVPVDPNADDEWEVETIEGVVAKASGVALDGTTVSMTLSNPNEQTCKFSFGIGKLNDDGTVDLVQKKNVDYGSIPQGWFFSGVDYNLASLNLPDGKYRLVPVSQLDGESEWKRCKPADVVFEVNVAGDEVTAVVHPILDIHINRFEMVSPGIPGNWQKVHVSVTNNGDNVEKTYYILVNGNWPGWSTSVKDLKIAAGKTKEFDLETGELPKGHYTLTLTDGWNGPVVAKQEVDIKQELVATAFKIGSDLKFAGTTLPVDVTVENHAGDNTLPLYLFASKSESSIGSRVYAAGTGIPGGGSEDVRFYFKPASAGTWYLSVATDAYGSKIIGKGTVDIEAAPTGTVKFERVGSSYKMLPNGRLDYTLTLRNTSSTTYYRNVWVNLYYNPKAGQTWYYHSEATSDEVVVEPGQEVTLNFTFNGLTEGTEYGFGPAYWLTYSGNTYTRLYQYANSEAFVYTAPAAEDPIPGDTSGDGLLTAEDVTPLIEYLTGKRSELPANADLNEDTKVDITDIVTLISKIIELQSQD